MKVSLAGSRVCVAHGARGYGRLPAGAGDAKPRCYEMIGARLAPAHPTPEPIRTVCGQVESALVGACLAGAGLRES